MFDASHETDARFMRRALRLAINGRGAVEPNPMVGCVIVRAGRVIGEGFHPRYGGPHAEPAALAAATSAGESTVGATAYVTLEPCCHTLKQTPPCVPTLIAAGMARVVVGCLDPNPAVNGKGLAALRAAGIDATAPVLDAEAKQLIAPFLARVRHRRPYVTLKWAQSADGKVAGAGGERLQISNDASSRAVHALRSRSDAVLIGIGTALVDDPLLTARAEHRPRPQRRIVLDAYLRLPLTSQLARTSNARDGCGVLVYTSRTTFGMNKTAVAALVQRHISVAPVATDADGRLCLAEVLTDLAVEGVTHVLVEPGPVLARSFLEQDLADRVWVIRSPRRVAQMSAPSAPMLEGYDTTGQADLEGDELTEWLNPRSPVFFGPFPSADFVMSAHQPMVRTPGID